MSHRTRRSLFARVRLARDLLREFEAEEAFAESYDYKTAVDRLLASDYAQGGIQTSGVAHWRKSVERFADRYDSPSPSPSTPTPTPARGGSPLNG